MRSFGFFRSISLGILFVSLLYGCLNSSKQKHYDFCVELAEKCVDKKFTVEMVTSKGKVLLEINSEVAPLTSTNFLFLVENRIYEGTSFNRAVKKPFPFIVQGGYKSSIYNLDLSKDEITNKSILKKEKVSLNFIPLEIKLKGEDNPRYNKLIVNTDDFNRIELTHQRGSVAMARSQALDSASFQFYITLKNVPELDGRYSVFGRVLEGIDIIESIEEGDIISSMNLVSF